jgi:hypothetical protein
MRQRVEDLGRISVLLDQVLELNIFELYEGRLKDFPDFFEELDEEKKEELLRKLIYGLDNIKDHVYKIKEIAEGQDRLNEPTERYNHICPTDY